MRFLRRGPLSHEHIWAEWIQTYVSRAFSKRMHTASFSGTLHAERIWNGDMLTDTIPCVRTLQQRLDEQVAEKSKAAHRSFSAGYLAHSRSLGFKVSGGMDHHVHNGLRIPRPPYSGDPFQAA